MINEEPISILSFLSRYFDIIRDLFLTQKNEGIIRRETFEIICTQNNAEGIRKTLFKYKIVRPIQDDYELRDVYYNLIEFILFEFRPLLPDEIEKYGLSISELFRKIKEGINSDKTILQDRIIALSDEVKKFIEAVDKNKIKLLSETRDLKANIKRIDYREKLQRASHWTNHYITPLNKILDVNHSESIANKLFDISDFVNQKRLNFDNEAIRLQFEKLHKQLIQASDDLRSNHKVFINELIPLIARIRTESLIISGWIEFLKQPNKLNPPKMFKADKDNPTSTKIYLNTKEYFELFQSSEDYYIEQDEEPKPRWIFNKTRYKRELNKSMPVKDFFLWCNSTLSQEGDISNEKLLALTTLLFEEEFNISGEFESDSIEIRTADSIFKVPKIKVDKNGI
jgi:hypothetical protein